MRAARIFAYNLVDGAVPNGLSLYTLGAGLLAAGLGHVLITLGFLDALHLLLILALLLAGLGNSALAAVASANALRRTSTLAARMTGDKPPETAFRFIHVAVAAHAALVLALLLPTLRALLDNIEGVFIGVLMPLTWTPLAGAALVLALLNGLRWDARFAALGAAASIAVFGCAVWYAPTIYGWDLQPLGWYAILVASIPALAFLAMFLRRHSRAFSESRWRSRAAALALFVALFCAVAIQITRAPADRFGANLQSALAADPLEIRLSDLTDFEWDAVEIYSRYTRAEDLSQDIIENTDIISRSYFSWMRETVDFVVFLKDGEIAYYEAVWRERRHKFEYPTGFDPMALRREDAVFTVRRGANRHTLTLKE